MDDIKSALEVELERLRKLVRKYRTESIVFAKPRKSKGPGYSRMYGSNEDISLCEKHDAVNSSNCEQPPISNVSKSRCVQFAPVDNCLENVNYPSSSDIIAHRPTKPSQCRTRFLDPLTNVDIPSRHHPAPKYPPEEGNFTYTAMDLIERRRFQESFLHLHEFYRKHYPLDSELVIELRTLRGVYEHTGGHNLALMAALENTLEEALKVEKDRRLMTLEDVHKPRKPDYFSPQYERDYRWQAAIRAYEIEQANREFRLIQSELERLKTLQAERRKQQE
ncbi:nachr subunit isoform 2 [Schistosoma japonicum]|uniref:Nachr subunit isoform 2 n=1 Tax=Schistosoma japonicum TaxID=6182 RepID=C1LEW8_SCHJA|nr:nachr subunit [Schistosoma japonicum]TNN11363.1 nachr subunit isoform 2 [Schistosoma japonicum]CAX73246.1 hypothetical protein [Schistosoma japonicum]